MGEGNRGLFLAVERIGQFFLISESHANVLNAPSSRFNFMSAHSASSTLARLMIG
jgi:hypothetical protein